VLTAAAALTTSPALWGAHGEARHWLVGVGLAAVFFSALGFIRDWNMPFVRNRADDPGFVDRRKTRKQAAQVQALVDQQMKIAQEREFNERMTTRFWHAGHGMRMRNREWELRFFVWADPQTFIDRSMRVGLVGTCVIKRGSEEFRSEEFECDLDHGFTRLFPDEFTPTLNADELMGTYEVEWSISDSQLASRDAFTLDANGQPL
jgi:hypothetical protein